MTDTTLDEHLKAWVISLRDELTDMPRDTVPARTLIGRLAIAVRGHGPIAKAVRSSIDGMADALRDRMPDTAWPVTIRFARDWDGHLSVDRLGVAGIAFGGLENVDRCGIVHDESVAWRGRSMFGLDRMAEDMALIARMCPPTNRPTQSWSMANNLMGTPHVSFDGIHARSEAEALLKMEWMREGRAGLEAVLAEGRMPERRNDERCWFVASELEDLDLDPAGRLPRKEDAAADIARHLAELSADDPQP